MPPPPSQPTHYPNFPYSVLPPLKCCCWRRTSLLKQTKLQQLHICVFCAWVTTCPQYFPYPNLSPLTLICWRRTSLLKQTKLQQLRICVFCVWVTTCPPPPPSQKTTLPSLTLKCCKRTSLLKQTKLQHLHFCVSSVWVAMWVWYCWGYRAWKLHFGHFRSYSSFSENFRPTTNTLYWNLKDICPRLHRSRNTYIAYGSFESKVRGCNYHWSVTSGQTHTNKDRQTGQNDPYKWLCLAQIKKVYLFWVAYAIGEDELRKRALAARASTKANAFLSNQHDKWEFISEFVILLLQFWFWQVMKKKTYITWSCMFYYNLSAYQNHDRRDNWAHEVSTKTNISDSVLQTSTFKIFVARTLMLLFWSKMWKEDV